MCLFKKRVEILHKGISFIAAYSDLPFAEAKHANSYPDYSFFDKDGIHWCVRIGNIDIPWGIGDNGRGYAANGTITVSRLSVDSTNFNKKGLPYTRVGDVYYLYESEFTGNGFVGFAPYLRDRLLPHIINVADSSPATSFQGELDTKLRENPELKVLLDSHNLTLGKVRVDRITNKKSQS